MKSHEEHPRIVFKLMNTTYSLSEDYKMHIYLAHLVIHCIVSQEGIPHLQSIPPNQRDSGGLLRNHHL